MVLVDEKGGRYSGRLDAEGLSLSRGRRGRPIRVDRYEHDRFRIVEATLDEIAQLDRAGYCMQRVDAVDDPGTIEAMVETQLMIITWIRDVARELPRAKRERLADCLRRILLERP